MSDSTCWHVLRQQWCPKGWWQKFHVNVISLSATSTMTCQSESPPPCTAHTVVCVCNSSRLLLRLLQPCTTGQAHLTAHLLPDQRPAAILVILTCKCRGRFLHCCQMHNSLHAPAAALIYASTQALSAHLAGSVAASHCTVSLWLVSVVDPEPPPWTRCNRVSAYPAHTATSIQTTGPVALFVQLVDFTGQLNHAHAAALTRSARYVSDIIPQQHLHIPAI